MPVAQIKKIIILGGGSSGWMTAAALSKALKNSGYHIQLIESAQISTVGVGEATIPQIHYFNHLLGIDEIEFVKQTQATFKLGIKFVDWQQIGHQYHHAFGESGKDINGVRFYHYWLKMKALGKASDFDHYSLNAIASEEKRFMSSIDAGNSPLSTIAYGYHFDASLFANYLQKMAISWGVNRTEGKVQQVNQHHDGSIRSLTLADGSEHQADFFIDCSGFRSLLMGETLNVGYENWDHWLPCDRAITVATAPVETPWSYTQAQAHSAGWQWRIPLQHRVGNGHVYASKFMSDDQAHSILHQHLNGPVLAEAKLIKFTTGRRQKVWHKNCLAIGLSSGFVEPLESTGLHLIQSSIERLLTLFPNKAFAQQDIDEFNQQAQTEVEGIRDFLILHYYATKRDDSPFWDYCRTMDIPKTLQEKIALFNNNGRIFRQGNELFDYQSWFQVMNGQGLRPQSYHPLVDMLPEAEIAQRMANILSVMRKSADYMPSHQTYIDQYCKAYPQ